MLNTIRGKITTGIIFISFTILIIINFTIWKIFQDNLQTSILNDMKRIMSIIHYEIQRQTPNEIEQTNLYNRNDLWTIMNTTNLQYDIYLSIKYDRDDYIQFAGEIIDNTSIKDIIMYSNKKSSLLYIHNENTRYFVTYSYPLYIKDKYVGMFVFQKDYLIQYDNYKYLMIRILGIQFILFIVMILTNYIWLKKSTDSLNTLLKGIRAIGEGKFSSRLEEKSNDEVAIIIHYFNKMQDQIVSQMEYLQQEKTKIENLEKSSRDFFNYATHEMKTPITSMAGIIGIGTFSHNGTSGQKISLKYSFVPVIFTMRNVQTANTKVIAMLPVTLAPPGKSGINPNRLLMKMKKNTVSR